MSAKWLGHLSWLALGLAVACATPGSEPVADAGEATPSSGEAPVVAPDPGIEAQLERRAEGFYLRLAHRRFNTLETYNDRIMREHFRDPALFLDYYADLAQALADSHFEKRRPLAVQLLGVSFEGPEAAQVEVRFIGADRRPLRPGKVDLLRTDRWVLEDGIWWVQPGKV